MAVIQTPQGRLIGLVIQNDQPKPDTKEVDVLAEAEEPPKRAGRPKKT